MSCASQIFDIFLTKFVADKMQSVYNKIKEVVEESDPGTLFFPEDFAAIGTSDAIRAALVRLCRSGVIMRAAQGIYYHPKVDTKWGSGIIPP